jgi:dihydrofolate reductase
MSIAAALPRLECVVAIARNGVIGRAGGLPWRLSADLRHFREITWGHPMLMGRRTWESIGRPLPGRRSLVLSRDALFTPDGATRVGSLAEACAEAAPARTVMVIGGAEIYALCLPFSTRLHITEVDAEPLGDAYFPQLQASEWREVDRRAYPRDERNQYPFSFVTLERAAGAADPA